MAHLRSATRYFLGLAGLAAAILAGTANMPRWP